MEALKQKARRGELFFTVAVGYVKVGHDKIEMDPDLRVREAIGLVFTRFAEMQSIACGVFALRGDQDRATVHQLQKLRTTSAAVETSVYATVRGAHAATHIGIDGKPFGFDQDLTRPRIGYRLPVQGPVFEGRHTFWVCREKPSAVRDILHRLLPFTRDLRGKPAFHGPPWPLHELSIKGLISKFYPGNALSV